MSINVSKVLVKSRETANGFPIKLRITHNRRSDYLGLNIYLKAVDYEKITHSKRLNPEQKDLKNKLFEIETRAIEIIKEMDNYSFNEFKNLYLGIVPDNTR